MRRVDTHREKHPGKLQDFGAQLGRFLINRDRVQVDNAVDAIVVVLDFDPVLQRTQIVSNVRTSGRLNARQDSCFHAVLGGTSILNEVQIEKWVYGGEALAR